MLIDERVRYDLIRNSEIQIAHSVDPAQSNCMNNSINDTLVSKFQRHSRFETGKKNILHRSRVFYSSRVNESLISRLIDPDKSLVDMFN